MAETRGEKGDSAEETSRIRMGGQLLVELSSGSYTSPAAALKEYVSNGWDAGASEITIRVYNPDDPDRTAFEVEDNGCGMTRNDLVDKFFRIGRNRRQEEGAVVDTIRGERRVHGRKGLGNLAGLKLTKTLEVVTWREDSIQGARLYLEEIEENPNNEPSIHWFDPDEKPSESDHGTLIRLIGFRRSGQIRDDILARNLKLWFEFGDEAEITLEKHEGDIGDSTIVDSETIGRSELFQDVEVETEELDVTWEEDGEEHTKTVTVKWGVLDESNTSVESLISIFSGTRALSTEEKFDMSEGFTNMFGIYKLVAEFQADWIDGMEGIDPADLRREEVNWEAHPALEELRRVGEKWVKKTCGEMAKTAEGKDEIRERTERLVESREEFESWPREHRNQLISVVSDFASNEGYATSELNRLIDLFAFVMNHGALIQFLTGLKEGGDRDLDTFLDVAERFNSSEITGLLQVAKSKLDIIQELQDLIADPETTEVPVEGKRDITSFLAKNPWMFDPELRIDHKDVTIKRILLKELGEDQETINQLPTEFFNIRPDFVGFSGPSDQSLCVELKHPTHTLDMDEAQRVVKYRAALMKEWPNIDIIVVSGDFRPDAKEILESQGPSASVEVMHFTTLFEKAENQMKEYIDKLEEGLEGISGTYGPTADGEVDEAQPEA